MLIPEEITDYTLAVSKTAAQLSEDIYEHSSRFDSNSLGKLTDSWTAKGKGSSRVFMGRASSGAIFIVFRGTNFADRSQVRSDLKISWIDEPDDTGQISAGFRQEIDYVYPDIRYELAERLMRQPAPIYITGHSLGGALATVCASRLLLLGLQKSDKMYVPSGLITFGSPRVGDQVFANHVKTINIVGKEDRNRLGLIRYRHNNDIVTRTPSMLRGFTHVSNMTYIDSKGNFYYNPWWHKRLWLGIKGMGLRLLSDSFEDHRMKYYRSAIMRAANRRGL